MVLRFSSAFKKSVIRKWLPFEDIWSVSWSSNSCFYLEQVRLERESLVVARTKLAQVTTELREKEAMLVALKQEMITEQKSLRDKVRIFPVCYVRRKNRVYWICHVHLNVRAVDSIFQGKCIQRYARVIMMQVFVKN